jgi:hypothetical protein
MTYVECPDCGMFTNDSLAGHRLGSWHHYEATGDIRSRYYTPSLESRTRPDPSSVRSLTRWVMEKLDIVPFR